MAATVARARARLDGAIADAFLADDARLDEEQRLAIGVRLAEWVGSVEVALRRQTARLLASGGDEAAAEAMLAGETALTRLSGAGLLRDADLMGEVIDQLRSERIAARLSPVDGAEPGLLVRLLGDDDPLVAASARGLLAADGRQPSARSDLPAELQHRLVWWVAAAIRQAGAAPAIDRALVEAARRWLAAADEAERELALASRLAGALDPRGGELPRLLLEALSDGRLSLFVALLARDLTVDATLVRTLALDPDAESLAWTLRAAGLGREEIAHAALALALADPRRDLDRFADRLDAIAAISPDAARESIASLTLPADYRLAIETLASGLR